jgi:hypothetical protein
MKNAIPAMLAAFVLTTGVVAIGSQSQAQGGRKLQTSMSGADEVPGPGDPDGTGSATISVNPGLGTVAFHLQVSGIDRSTAAHIHEGGPQVAGPVVVTLAPPDSSGQSVGTVKVDARLAQAIVKSPSAYYVNVHNAAYPSGAVRGQLGK